MDFFAAQEARKRATRRLVVLFALASALIVAAVTVVGSLIVAALEGTLPYLQGDPLGWAGAHAGTVVVIALAAAALIAVSSLVRMASLSAGGAQIARQLGATEVPADVTDPLRRRLRNVVEEIAIASGVPVPEIFVLEDEAGINAFAAGFTPGDAAVAVTRGALERLDRAALQGVVAHEFSHIVNGDMRLNLRLVGVLFGILVIGLVGRWLLRSGRYAGLRRSGSGRGGNAAFVVFAGAALALVGGIGVLLGRMIKAGVSREREFLADASAVQFTRDPNGLAEALKAIAGLPAGSSLGAHDAEEISHMLFARGSRVFRSVFATHPPLAERIRALDPAFDPEAVEEPPLQTAGAAGAAGLASPGGDGGSIGTAELAGTVGAAGPDHLARAGRLLSALPAPLSAAVHEREGAVLSVLALLLHPDERKRESQIRLLAWRLGTERTERVVALYETIARLGPAWRLPLLDLAYPSVKDRPRGQLVWLVELATRLVELDGEVELFEWTLLRLLEHYLDQAVSRRAERDHRDRLRREDLAAASVLIAAVAGHGQHGRAAASAYRAGLDRLRELTGAAVPADETLLTTPEWTARTDRALARLRLAPPAARRALIDALMQTAATDGRLSIAETELLRVVCAALHCPLPPALDPPVPPAASTRTPDRG